MDAIFILRHGLHFFLFAQQHVTDKIVYLHTKSRVKPYKPCLKMKWMRILTSFFKLLLENIVQACIFFKSRSIIIR